MIPQMHQRIDAINKLITDFAIHQIGDMDMKRQARIRSPIGRAHINLRIEQNPARLRPQPSRRTRDQHFHP
jgi:hypothetical protein